MSASLHPDIAAAAARYASEAEEAARLGRPTGKQREPGPMPAHLAQRIQDLKARITAKKEGTVPSLSATVWVGMPLRVRAALIMLATNTPGDPREMARQSWDAFADADKVEIGAVAREFHEGTRSADCLW